MNAASKITVATALVWFSVAGAAFAADQHAEHTADHRVAISVDAEAKEHLLLEMRQLLETVHHVLDGALKKDMKAVATYAEAVGLKAMRATPASITNQLPKEFKMMGRGVHEAMDNIARDAKDMGDSQHTIEQVNTLLGSCVSCHATFKLK